MDFLYDLWYKIIDNLLVSIIVLWLIAWWSWGSYTYIFNTENTSQQNWEKQITNFEEEEDFDVYFDDQSLKNTEDTEQNINSSQTNINWEQGTKISNTEVSWSQNPIIQTNTPEKKPSIISRITNIFSWDDNTNTNEEKKTRGTSEVIQIEWENDDEEARIEEDTQDQSEEVEETMNEDQEELQTQEEEEQEENQEENGEEEESSEEESEQEEENQSEWENTEENTSSWSQTPPNTSTSASGWSNTGATSTSSSTTTSGWQTTTSSTSTSSSSTGNGANTSSTSTTSGGWTTTSSTSSSSTSGGTSASSTSSTSSSTSGWSATSSSSSTGWATSSSSSTSWSTSSTSSSSSSWGSTSSTSSTSTSTSSSSSTWGSSSSSSTSWWSSSTSSSSSSWGGFAGSTSSSSTSGWGGWSGNSGPWVSTEGDPEATTAWNIGPDGEPVLTVVDSYFDNNSYFNVDSGSYTIKVVAVHARIPSRPLTWECPSGFSPYGANSNVSENTTVFLPYTRDDNILYISNELITQNGNDYYFKVFHANGVKIWGLIYKINNPGIDYHWTFTICLQN